MRVWLDPDKLKAYGLTVLDVENAIKHQNIQVAAGQIGGPPAPANQLFQFTVNTLGRVSDVEQFENIIIKSQPPATLASQIFDNHRNRYPLPPSCASRMSAGLN